MISAKHLPQEGYGHIIPAPHGHTLADTKQRRDVTILQAPHQQGITSCQHPASIRRVDELKKDLLDLMARHQGSTKHPDVHKAIQRLSECNPFDSSSCSKLHSFTGNFQVASCPDFSGRIRHVEGKEDCIQYTLGRMTFNQFRPQNLVCTLTSVDSPVSVLTEHSDDDIEDLDLGGGMDGTCQLYSYPLVQNIIIHTPAGIDLAGKVVHEAICQEHGKVSNRFSVSFTGTTLAPAQEVLEDPEKFKAWMDTFHQHNADKLADQPLQPPQTGITSLKSCYHPNILDSFQYGIGRISRTTTNILPPSVSPSLSCRGKFHVNLKAKGRGGPKGYIDVVYLDDEIRITKGNRGTFTVVYRINRMPSNY